jgi:hypothetical protein
MKNEMVCPKAQSGECKIKCDFIKVLILGERKK